MADRVDLDRMLDLVADGATLVDVLPAPLFDAVHLPGARNLPLATLTRSTLDQFDREHPIVLYCYDQH
jgi:rhodanese-related sulfurtransferase